MSDLPDTPSDVPQIPCGTYRHYKGDIYQVIGIGHDSNRDDDPNGPRLVVVYVAPPGASGPALAVRNLYPDPDASLPDDGTGFFDWVDPGTGVQIASHHDAALPFTRAYDAEVAAGRIVDGKPARHTQAVRRFTYLGPSRP